jgi:hypothetical protein
VISGLVTTVSSESSHSLSHTGRWLVSGTLGSAV